MKKYIFSYLHSLLQRIFAGRKNYDQWKQNYFSLKQVKVKRAHLAEELEKNCRNRDGFLTFSEFLWVDQFGTYGYHNTHKTHGLTRTHAHWGKTVAYLCKKNNIDHVVEFGPGNGSLAIEMFHQAKKIDKKLAWSGVELNEQLRKTIISRFKKENLLKPIQLCSGIDDLKLEKPVLFIDEVTPPPPSWNTYHLSFPKDLESYTRTFTDTAKLYKTTGTNLLYYPTFLDSYLEILSSLGFVDTAYDIEQKMAFDLRNEKWKEKSGFYTTYGLYTEPKIKKVTNPTLVVSFPKS